ncbi:MAG: hypothetical protein LT103_04705 [Burkholderiaceae bacterium]|nr:hypothetical protein [Burkholderiaceae bacterium]
MSQFVFPAWVEDSPSLFRLCLGPRAVGLKTAYGASALVTAEIDAQGPFWRASVPVLAAGGWEHRALGQRFASAADAKAAAERAIAAVGQGDYDAQTPANTLSVAITSDGVVRVGGRPVEVDPVDQEQIRALSEQLSALVIKDAVLAMLDELRSDVCGAGSPVE